MIVVGSIVLVGNQHVYCHSGRHNWNIFLVERIEFQPDSYYVIRISDSEHMNMNITVTRRPWECRSVVSRDWDPDSWWWSFINWKLTRNFLLGVTSDRAPDHENGFGWSWIMSGLEIESGMSNIYSFDWINQGEGEEASQVMGLTEVGWMILLNGERKLDAVAGPRFGFVIRSPCNK